MRRFGGIALSACFILLFPSILSADSTDCNNPTFLVTDGRITQSTIPASTSFWFAVDHLEANASYSIHVDFPLVAQDFPSLNVFRGSDINFGDCSATTSLTLLFNHSTEPSTENGERTALTTPGNFNDERLYIRMTNDSGASRAYTITVSETTQYNPRWSTFGGFSTQWGFHNTSRRQNVMGTLRVFKTDGSLVATDTFSVSPGRVVFKTSTGLGIAANQAGNAIFTHNGPPGAIQADAFLVSGDLTVVVPAKFEPAREATH